MEMAQTESSNTVGGQPRAPDAAAIRERFKTAVEKRSSAAFHSAADPRCWANIMAPTERGHRTDRTPNAERYERGRA
jgi:hypothetical protein